MDKESVESTREQVGLKINNPTWEGQIFKLIAFSPTESSVTYEHSEEGYFVKIFVKPTEMSQEEYEAKHGGGPMRCVVWDETVKIPEVNGSLDMIRFDGFVKEPDELIKEIVPKLNLKKN